MADPARVKNEPGNDVTAAESAHQDDNAGEGPSGGNAASETTTDQTSINQGDKVVRRDPVRTAIQLQQHTPRHKNSVGTDVSPCLTVYPSLCRAWPRKGSG